MSFLIPDPRCLETLQPGNCADYVVRWYYDQQVNSCARFWFSGCNGSGNRFNSEKECQESCIQAWARPWTWLPQKAKKSLFNLKILTLQIKYHIGVDAEYLQLSHNAALPATLAWRCHYAHTQMREAWSVAALWKMGCHCAQALCASRRGWCSDLRVSGEGLVSG